MNKQLKVYKCKVVVKNTVDIVVVADSEESALNYLGSDDAWHDDALDLHAEYYSTELQPSSATEITRPEESPWSAECIPYGDNPYLDEGIAERLFIQENSYPAGYEDDTEDERSYDEWHERLKAYQIRFDEVRKRSA